MFFDSWLATVFAVLVGMTGAFGTLYFFRTHAQREVSRRQAMALWALTAAVVILSIYALATDFGSY